MMPLASDDLLREIEDMADAVDLLDAQARVGDQPYFDESLDAPLVAKRNRLLLELEVAQVLDPKLADTRAKLVALRLPQLVSYHDAAVAMTRYFGDPARARLVRAPVPARLNDARISLDWFRKPTGYAPPGVDAASWLALCETNFLAAPRSRCGSLFTRLEGRMHQLWFRTELAEPKLYRAEP